MILAKRSKSSNQIKVLILYPISIKTNIQGFPIYSDNFLTAISLYFLEFLQSVKIWSLCNKTKYPQHVLQKKKFSFPIHQYFDKTFHEFCTKRAKVKSYLRVFKIRRYLISLKSYYSSYSTRPKYLGNWQDYRTLRQGYPPKMRLYWRPEGWTRSSILN